VKRLAPLLLVLALAACGGGGSSDESAGDTTTQQATTQQATTGSCTTAAQHASSRTMKDEHLKLDPAKTYRIVFHTNCGDFTVTFDQKTSPNATGSLVSLAQRGFFDDTYFHRIVPGFVIQGGDPTGTGTGGPGYSTHDKVPQNASYAHGVVAMAKSGAEPPGTAGSQFFVVTGADASLPPDYAVVGKVTSGLDVVDMIGGFGDSTEQPTRSIVISKAKVETS
jgi:cyclophilin family peptidyl-prolyl cis-trans isomerase